MEHDGQPVIVGFDGSPEATAAVRAAAELFPGRTLLIASVWEPGLALAVTYQPDTAGVSYPPPSADEIATVDRLQHDHAEATAEIGVRLARSLGATAQPAPVPDSANVSHTLAAMAEEHHAAALVIGSRGRGRVRASLLGSTSSGVMHHTRRPVLVVRAPA